MAYYNEAILIFVIYLLLLQRQHPDQHKEYKSRKDCCVVESEGSSSSGTLTVRSTAASKYARSDPAQKSFEKHLMSYVLLDTVPFNAIQGDGFKQLISSFDGKLQVPSTSTVRRHVLDEFEKVIPSNLGNTLDSGFTLILFVFLPQIRFMTKGLLSTAGIKCLHFVIDLWTSFQMKSIMGVKVQFVHKWKLMSLRVGLKHFPVSHTAENIRTLMEDFFEKDLGIKPNQVAIETIFNH